MQENAKNIEYSQDFSIERLRELCKLLTILSKLDTLILLVLAKNGIKSHMDTPKEIGLTKKQYYTRLKQLVDHGLVEKRDGYYFHTTMGKFVYEKHLASLLEGTKKDKEMRMIDMLNRTRTFSHEEISNFTKTIYER